MMVHYGGRRQNIRDNNLINNTHCVQVKECVDHNIDGIVLRLGTPKIKNGYTK